MSLYSAIAELKAVLHSGWLQPNECDFAKELLDNLVDISQLSMEEFGTQSDLTIIKEAIEKELNKTKWWWLGGARVYRDALLLVLKNIIAVETKYAELEEVATTLEFKLSVIDRSEKLETKKDPDSIPHHRVMPITQGFDFRLGYSPGECFGFTTEWIRASLENESFAGIPTNNSPLGETKSVPLDSVKPENYHAAPLTEQIHTLQRLGTPQKTPLGLMGFYIRMEPHDVRFYKKTSLRYRTEKTISVYSNPGSIADRLIAFANDKSKPNRVYMFELHQYSGGSHVTGFKKDTNGKYHFFDSNSGWVKFDNEKIFKKWFELYFNNYSQAGFKEYSIHSYRKNRSYEKDFKEGNTLDLDDHPARFEGDTPSIGRQIFEQPIVRALYYAGSWIVNKISSLFSSAPSNYQQAELNEGEQPRIRTSYQGIDVMLDQETALARNTKGKTDAEAEIISEARKKHVHIFSRVKTDPVTSDSQSDAPEQSVQKEFKSNSP